MAYGRYLVIEREKNGLRCGKKEKELEMEIEVGRNKRKVPERVRETDVGLGFLKSILLLFFICFVLFIYLFNKETVCFKFGHTHLYLSSRGDFF